MKKGKIFGVIFILILITGCGKSNGVKTMSCTRTMDQNGIKTSLIYTVTYSNDIVKKVKSEESVETDSSDILSTYKEQIESLYSPYKDVKYYTYNVSIEGNKLISSVDIDYEKIDTDKLLEIDSSNGQLIKDGKIKIDDIKSVYETIGATCKKN